MLLLHGWGCSSDLFEPIAANLQQDFDVVVPDLPGFGQTPPPPAAWSVADYADWVVGVLDDLGLERVSLVGHSFGGRVALKIAVRHPQRVSGIVATSSAGIRPRRTLRYHLKVRAYKALRALSSWRGMPAPIHRFAEAQATKRGSADYRAAAGTVRTSFVRIVNEDQRDELPTVKVPTLLIWGDQDTETPPSDGRLMEALIPDAGFILFPGAGHFAYLEQPEYFSRIVRTFLKDGEQ